MDKHMVTFLILFDFSKAFDTVDPDLLIQKLVIIGFSESASRWIASYLTGRSITVKDSVGNLTDWIHTNAGVPQGSILDTLWFSLFINDIGLSIRFCRRLLYADDLETYLACLPHQLDESIRLIDDDIEHIHA
ncbi:uncharacterized protein LOC130673892 [Microplitis mediator]|uniref:uncharacterized protein LOC130673892 n=1 Tax=Microplitis mediator TaxID=375433 RepID=UPI00255632F3|nr:uncharacterized protein LOC130673892 [Microplitis mediator]